MSHLQNKLFKEYSETSILPHVQKVDVNKDGFISQEDLKAYKVSI